MNPPLKNKSSKWPKAVIPLTPKQIEISDDWMKYFHEINHTKFSQVVDFGHNFVSQRARKNTVTMEIGAGLGAHLNYENNALTQCYLALENRFNMAEVLKKNFPWFLVVWLIAKNRYPLKNASVDRVIAIHVLEHLSDLPSCLQAVHHVLKSNGTFLVVIPCEGGIAYEIARTFTSKHLFEKRYKTPYRWHIKSEHVNMAWEVLEELQKCFVIKAKRYYPFSVPFIHLNAVIGLELTPR